MSTTDKIKIRNAGEPDIAAMFALLTAFARELGEPTHFHSSEEAMRKYGFGESPLFCAALAERESSALGLCVYFSEFSTWRGKPGVYIQDIYVHPEQRKDGLGRRLLEHALHDANACWGAQYLRLAVHTHNESAIRFYQSLGMSLDAENHIMVLDPETTMSIVAGEK
ncbi:MAG: GNAT family N-acetyltransferase [Pseudomonadota bacterium]